MNGGIVEPSRPAAVYRSFVPPSKTDLPAFVWTAALLVCLLVGVVPGLTLTTDVAPLALVLGAGIGYVLVLFATETGFEGLASAVVVLSVFDIGIRLVQGPAVTSLDLMAVDIAAIPLLLVFLHYGRTEFSLRRLELNGRMVAAFALGIFVCWTFLSAVVANGVSSVAPIMYAVQQLRYGVLFVLAILLVRTTNPWCVVYPLVLAIGGNLAFALAQVANGGGFGLRALGETPTVILGTFTLGPMRIPYGSYAGGFVGHSREFTIILLLFIPLAFAVAARHSWLHVLYAVVSVAAAVLVIRTADTDAGWAALILTGVLLAATFGYAVLRDRHRGIAVSVLVAGIVASVAASALAVAVVLRASAQTAPHVPLFDTRTLPVRVEQYATALDIALDYPLFGLGGGNFYLMAEKFGFSSLRGIHGIVFSYLATIGVVGAAAYVVGVVAVLAVAFRRFLRTAGDERLLWGALVCGMVGFHAYSLFDLAHLWDAALSVFWILMGVVVGSDTRRFTSIL